MWLTQLVRNHHAQHYALFICLEDKLGIEY